MNSIRTKENIQRAWLKVERKNSLKPGYSILKSELFDGTPFEFEVADYEYEDQGPNCPALIEVGFVGNVGNIPTSKICEIVLPAPVLTLGHNVRVADNSLLKWESYNLIKEKNKAARNVSK